MAQTRDCGVTLRLTNIWNLEIGDRKTTYETPPLCRPFVGSLMTNAL